MNEVWYHYLFEAKPRTAGDITTSIISVGLLAVINPVILANTSNIYICTITSDINSDFISDITHILYLHFFLQTTWLCHVTTTLKPDYLSIGKVQVPTVDELDYIGYIPMSLRCVWIWYSIGYIIAFAVHLKFSRYNFKSGFFKSR